MIKGRMMVRRIRVCGGATERDGRMIGGRMMVGRVTGCGGATERKARMMTREIIA